MPNSLASPPVRPVLDRLFQTAHSDDAAHWVTVRERYPDGFPALSAREQADAAIITAKSTPPTASAATTLLR